MDLNADRWLAHFRRNRLGRPEPDWTAPVTLPADVVTPLVRSLEQFHLGDGGGPASLIAFNAESFRGQSESSRQLVDLWFDEEKEHSRLLSGAVKRFGGTPIDGHWSFWVFCQVRRWLGVRFELTVLLLTEIVSTAYYRLLWRRCGRCAVWCCGMRPGTSRFTATDSPARPPPARAASTGSGKQPSASSATRPARCYG
jgi:hypothetical protein